MTEEKLQLAIGALLHDIGKVIYRQGDGRRHSLSGYDFLREEVKLENKNILESVRYHHSKELASASISTNSFAYITYIADNIAASTDRRKNDGIEKGFEINAPLEPVFNILNENDGNKFYSPGMLGDGKGINFPSAEKKMFDKHFYDTVKNNLIDNLRGIDFSKEYLNSLIEILEGNLSYVPSSTAKDELADISLYDHSKLTSALAVNIYDYLNYNKITDYRDKLYKNSKDFYDEKVFLLLSMDVSGIQSFIYTIYSEGALKNLRARSFYLEIMMEHIVDTLFERLELSRANLIYVGGGHCYIILANTDEIKKEVIKFEKEINEWFIDKFDISLYIAMGYAECSANDLQNNPNGSYAAIFRKIGENISQKKSRRYTAEQIIKMNEKEKADYTRECRVCKRLGKINEDKECKICEAILEISKNVLYSDFFVVTDDKKGKGLILPFDMYLSAENKETLLHRIKSGENFKRIYGKNVIFSGANISTRLWVGNYTTGESFEQLAQSSNGIERIGVLRADVDNLGKAFVSGFNNKRNGDKYVTISRTATLSRQLSLFFKYHINQIFENPEFMLNGEKKEKRKATIVYSGGDDLFIVGAWDEIIELAVDIKKNFEKYTENTLTM